MAPDDRANNQPGLVPINMTPLIDVALVLVVALLVMSSLGLESGFQVRAQATAAASSAEAIAATPAPIAVTILSPTEVRVDDRVLHRGQLRPVLTAMLRQRADDAVTVRCDDRVTHAVFVDVLDQVKLSGAGAIAIAAEDGR